MELNPTYLTYEEYKKMGGTILEQFFNSLEYKAELIVDKYTFNRFRKIKSYPNELKICIFDLINVIDNLNNSMTGNGISSETVGSYSVTKSSVSDINFSYRNTINAYLSNVKVNGVPVLYRGTDIYDN